VHRDSFYVNPKDVHGDELTFPEDEVRHMYKVLRKKKGDTVWAVDGEGTAYQVEIQYIGRNGGWGKIRTIRRRLGEPVADITLAQSVLKGDRFEWLVEKSVEMGVHRIIPMITENTVTTAGPQKLARWRRVALAAMKQCGRSVLPEITEAKTITQVLALGTGCSCRLIAHPAPEGRALLIKAEDQPAVTQKAVLVVGPEGGFTEEEIAEAGEQGYLAVSLGPRRLRAETAGIVFLSLFLSQTGELT